jgi:hypothetical protein
MGARDSAGRLTLTDVRRIATDVAHALRPSLDVVGVRHSQEGRSYTEVFLTSNDSRPERSRVIVGLHGDLSASECRQAIETELHRYLADLRPLTA